jgi:hypothetical protein
MTGQGWTSALLGLYSFYYAYTVPLAGSDDMKRSGQAIVSKHQDFCDVQDNVFVRVVASVMYQVRHVHLWFL